jgi:glycosyltransferase involved in cell wall biosynthesis
MNILFVVPELALGGTARRVCQLAAALPRERLALTVAVLGRATPLARDLVRCGVAVHTLGGGWLDPGALWRLRALDRDLVPDLIHAWRPEAVRALALAVGRPRCPLFVSEPLRGGKRPGMPDRWLMRRATRILVGSAAAADRCRRFGFPTGAIEVVRPAVEAIAAPAAPPASTATRIVCAGRMERHRGQRDAIWAFDILHYLVPELRLQLIGDGPERSPLEEFTNRIGMSPLVQFAGTVPDLAAPLAAAEVVWVPSLAPAGVQIALEAQALGRPVIASRFPELAEVVAGDATGCLVAPGDKVGLAQATKPLLQDAGWRRQLGEAGKVRVLREFPVSELVRHVGDLFERAA